MGGLPKAEMLIFILRSMFSLLTQRFFPAPHSFILTYPIKELKIFNKLTNGRFFVVAVLLPTPLAGTLGNFQNLFCSSSLHNSTLLNDLLGETDNPCKEEITVNKINTMV